MGTCAKRELWRQWEGESQGRKDEIKEIKKERR